MNRGPKIGRNYPCPCGSGKKYKFCCLGKVDWQILLSDPHVDASRHLSVRGKNISFINSIATALQLDNFSPQTPFHELKRAFTPKAVQEIFMSVSKLWPDLNDFERCLSAESGSVTALYTGNYDPEAVFRAVTRLAIYCDKIYLVDPFIRAAMVRDEYSPLKHPEEHRATTIKYSFLWMSLAPWIEAGLINFIRPLDDFIPGLTHNLIKIERERFDANSDLKAMLDEEINARIKKTHPLDRDMGELYLLSMPDDALREIHRKCSGFTSDPFNSVDDFVKYIQTRRDEHPYFVERMPGQRGELHLESSGACYELAKRMCAFTNSHIVTDLRVRWKELELDRQAGRIALEGWSPFAKTLQECDFKLLNHVPMQAALKLREEKRLESLRLFLRKVWNNCRDPDEFSASNAVNLAAELREEVAKANEEWRKIDEDLLKWIGVAGAALVTSGVVGFVPAAAGAAVTGVTGLIHSNMKRSTFKDRHPAGFFLGLK